MGAGSDKTFLTPHDGRPGVCLRKDPSRARGEEGGEEWRAEGRRERVKGTGGTGVGGGERREGRGGVRSHCGPSFFFRWRREDDVDGWARVRAAPSMLPGAKRSPVFCPQVLRRLSRLNFEGAGPTGAIARRSHTRVVHPKRQQIICRGLLADVSCLRRAHRTRPPSAPGSTWGDSEHGLPSKKGRWVASSRVRYGMKVSMGCPARKDAG